MDGRISPGSMWEPTAAKCGPHRTSETKPIPAPWRVGMTQWPDCSSLRTTRRQPTRSGPSSAIAVLMLTGRPTASKVWIRRARARREAMIVDRMLPGMDGLTIIEALRHEGMRTPVLVLKCARRGGRPGARPARRRRRLSDQAVRNGRAHRPDRGTAAPAGRKPRYRAAGRSVWSSISSHAPPSAATARSICCRVNSAYSNT